MSSSVVPSDSIVAPVAIDRESFRTELQLVALAVPANKTKSFVDHLKGFVFKLSSEQQQLVEDYDCGRLGKSLRRLVAQRAPVYRGVGASVESRQ